MKLNCIITDDEPNAVNLLEVLITQSTEWQIVAKCFNGLEALQAVKQFKPDLIFMDINMPMLDGMSLAGLLPPEVKIVFTTAYSEYAVDSYNYSAIDYLLKPVTLKRFLDAQKKIELAFDRPAVDNGYFFAKTGGSLTGMVCCSQLVSPSTPRATLHSSWLDYEMIACSSCTET